MRQFIRLCAFLVTISSVQAQNLPFASYDLASDPVLADPHDLAFGPDGRLYVADKFGHRIAVFDPDTMAHLGMLGEGQFPGIHDISFAADGLAYLAVTGMDRVDVVRIEGDTLTRVRSYPGLPRTEGALIHSNGRLYVMAGGIGQLVAIEGDQAVASFAGAFGAHDVAEAPDGSIWLADNGQSQVLHLSQDLQLLDVFGAEEFGFVGPRYLDIDDFGRLVVADQDAHRVLLIDPLAPKGDRIVGILGDGTPGIGPGKFDDPEGVAVRGNQYYVSDSDNNRIVRYSVVTN